MEDYRVKDVALADEGRRRIEWARGRMPVLELIGDQYVKEGPLEGVSVAACLHVTVETANLFRVLISGGATVTLTGSNPLSTQDDVAAALAEEGVGVYASRGESEEEYYECIEDARRGQKHGVAMVTRKGGFLAGKKLFLKHGFEVVDQAPPAFDLLVKRFGNGPLPAFPTDWAERAERYGPGLTVIRSGQCPYFDDAVNTVVETAGKMGMQVEVVELQSGREAQEAAPSAYGVFSIVYNGELLSFHPIGEKEFLKRLGERAE